MYSIKLVNSDIIESDNYNNIQVMTGNQTTVRFIVKNVPTEPNEHVYITGSVYELGYFSYEDAIGPMYNEVVYQGDTYYLDINVPEDMLINFKFLIKDSSGNVKVEEHDVHSFKTSINSTSEVLVKWNALH
ncbi:Cyclomaltodextrin glucanotransferase precursor [compost metagenome]